MRPLVMLLGPGQGGDSPMFEHVMKSLSVPRVGPGRPRTTPVRALGDKAYSSRANRQFLRQRGIQAVIPERSDQIANRQRRGSKGGRPVSCDVSGHRSGMSRDILRMGRASVSDHRGSFRWGWYPRSGSMVCSAMISPVERSMTIVSAPSRITRTRSPAWARPMPRWRILPA